jgi:serine/threonine-protein kinase HipA
MTDRVEVWLDADFLERTRVGTLTHDRGTLRFVYEPEWLKNSQAFALDPDLSLGEGTYFPIAEAGNFRVFDDSAPDRWGQTLMKRREALAAKDENRKPKTLYAWDFLLGVEDVSRQGALRFRRPDEEVFLAHESLTVPPAANLKELEIVAGEISAKRIDDLKALRQWLKVLVAPGASLGGARPKASFSEINGSLWIAKFPAADDTRDVGAWEALAQRLAARAGSTYRNRSCVASTATTIPSACGASIEQPLAGDSMLRRWHFFARIRAKGQAISISRSSCRRTAPRIISLPISNSSSGGSHSMLPLATATII